MRLIICTFLIIFSFNVYAEFDTKCSVLITKRLQSSEDAYKDALVKINSCNKYDILSVTSFLEEPISKVYICLLYTSPSPRDVEESRMPSSA